LRRRCFLAVLNLEGIFSRYENPDAVLDRITSASLEEATKIIVDQLFLDRLAVDALGARHPRAY
jgi:uncharacterized protein YaaN involved in tellurite resistance